MDVWGKRPVFGCVYSWKVIVGEGENEHVHCNGLPLRNPLPVEKSDVSFDSLIGF